MITNEQRETLLSNLTKKGLNKRTQNYILKYANKNSELFSDCIDMDKLIDRLSTNIDKNISYDMLNPLLNGAYFPGNKNIRLSPKLLFNKKKRESTILHEIDHAATTTYAENSREDITKMINDRFKSPFIQKLAMITTKSKSITELKDKAVDYYIRHSNGRIGIHQDSKNRALNEGITRYKQLKYMGDELKGGYHTFIRDSYGPECKVASELAKIIGEDNLVKMSFNNDFDGMCKLFSERTDGKGNLEEISSKLDETHSRQRHLHPMKFIKNYSSISRQLKECKKVIQEKDSQDISKNIEKDEPSFGDQFQEMVQKDINIEEYQKPSIDKEKALDIGNQQVPYERTRW